MGDRRCEGCNGNIPPRTHRQKNDKGQMVCEECIRMNTPTWTAGLAYAAGLGPDAEQEMRQRMVASIASVARVLRHTKTAHDSGDNAIINHCPFCGSGAVIGGGDGTVSCDFCHTNFTVQVQPAHPFMPQTVDGQPVPPAGMPGEQPTEMSAPLDPAVNETEEGVVEDPTAAGSPTPFNDPAAKKPEGDKPGKPKGENPFAKGSSVAYRTDDGRTLDEDAYMARLALAHADDRDEVLDVVRMRHTAASGATVTCPRCTGSGTEPDGTDMACSSCDGTGLVWVKVPGVEAKQADLLNPDTRIDDNDYDLLARHDKPHDGDLLADNWLTIPDQFSRPSREWWGAER